MSTWLPDAPAMPAGLRIKVLDDPRVLERLRILDKVSFPVVYTDKYYDALVANGWHKFSYIALFHDALVGSITSRFETIPDSDQFRLYIMTIAVLEPYRHMGIGSILLRTVLEQASQDIRIAKVALHVQEGAPVFQFYQRFGFVVQEHVPDYYTNIEPTNNALLLVKPVEHTPATLAAAAKAKAGAAKK